MPIPVRTDHDAARLRLAAAKARTPDKPGACWRWPRSMMVSAAQWHQPWVA